MPLGDWLDQTIDSGISLGFVYKASGIENLAALIGVSAENITAAIEAAGNPMITLEEEYYIAIEGTSCAISTCGGVQVNEKMQVVKADGSVIGNLFMGGTDSLGNLMATCANYPLGDHAAMWAISGGNIAGLTAAELTMDK